MYIPFIHVGLSLIVSMYEQQEPSIWYQPVAMRTPIILWATFIFGGLLAVIDIACVIWWSWQHIHHSNTVLGDHVFFHLVNIQHVFLSSLLCALNCDWKKSLLILSCMIKSWWIENVTDSISLLPGLKSSFHASWFYPHSIYLCKLRKLLSIQNPVSLLKKATAKIYNLQHQKLQFVG